MGRAKLKATKLKTAQLVVDARSRHGPDHVAADGRH
jgi:hypothetical protein